MTRPSGRDPYERGRARWRAPRRRCTWRAPTRTSRRARRVSRSASTPWLARATSGSWRTSTPARPRRPSGSSTTPVAPTRSARSTRARPSWTGWRRSASAASRSRRPPPRASGRATGSTSSTRPATSTSRSRSSGRCACSTARWPCSTPWPASSRSPRPCGARPTATACRASAFVNKMDRTGANFTRTVEMMVDRLNANPLVLQLPWGSEGDFKGCIDLVQMNAHYWEGDMGEEWKDTDIPAEYLEAAKLARHELFEKLAESDEELFEKFVNEEEPTVEELKRADPHGHASPATASRCSAAPRSRTRACSCCWTPWSTSCRARWTSPPVEGHLPFKEDQHVERKPDDAEPFAALAFKIMSDPYVGRLTYLRVYSGVLRSGSHVLNATKDRKERIGRDPADAREPPRGHGRGVHRRHRGRGRAEARHHRRHDLRPRQARRAGADQLPDAGDQRGRRAEDEGRPGQAGRGAREARRRGSDVRRALRRRDRADRHLGDGRAAPRHHRRPPAPRVQRRRERRQAAGRVPRDDHEARAQGGHALRPPDRRPRPVRPRRDRPRADRPRRRLRVHQQDLGRGDPARVHPRRSTRASRKRWTTASSPATRSSTCAPR